MPSSVPGAVSNLVTILGAAFTAASQNVQINQGKLLERFIQPLNLQIVDVVGDQTPAELGQAYRREEKYKIECQLVSWSGDEDFPARRAEVFALWDTVTTTIGNNPWLATSGVNDSTAAVRLAMIGSFTFYADADRGGHSLGCISFDIDCQQRIRALS